jgi:predicted MFS family arabinose efflux permease
MPGARRDFYKLWAGQTISEIGSRITREGLPLTADRVLHVGPESMGVLAAVGSASVLLFGVAAGVVADRMRRRPLMIASDLARAVVLATIPLAAYYGRLSFLQLLLVSALAGVFTVQFDVAYQSYLPALLPKKDLLEGNRRLGMSASFAEIIGPGLTGVLVLLITAPLAILIDSISFVVSAVSVWVIRTPEPKPAPTHHASLWHEASQGGREILRHPVLRALAMRSITAFFSMGLSFALYIIYATRVLQFNTAVLGFTIALGGIGSFAGAYLTGHATRRFGPIRVMIGGALLTAVMNLLVPLAASDTRYAVLCMGAAQLFGDAGFSFYFINETTVRQQIVPEHLLGRVNAAMQLASRGVLPLGALAGGVLGERIGIVPTLWIGMTGVLLSCLWLIPLRAMRESPQAMAG